MSKEDFANEFLRDCQQKRQIAQSASHKKTARSASGPVLLPLDFMSKKEREEYTKPGECKSYNLYDPVRPPGIERPLRFIAVDFDGTIRVGAHLRDPDQGLMPDCADCLRVLFELGFTNILWTCRTGKHLDEALLFMERYGIAPYFKYVNENPECGFNTSPKIFAHYFLDDLNLGGFPGWRPSTEYILWKEGLLK